MSVASHLAIDLAEYDSRIRTFIPHYHEMLDVVCDTLRATGRPVRRIVDLGTGTGALALGALTALPGATVHGIDADGGMLAMARRRLPRRRATLVHGSFLNARIPRCDAVIASFALHHVSSRRARGSLNRRIRSALCPRGVLVSADCHPSSVASVAAAGRRAWRAHLSVAYGPRQAERFLRAWALEDFYVPLDAELRLLRSAGLAPEVIWRRGAFAVVAGWKS
jgi:SAM-dependent methyltransferase